MRDSRQRRWALGLAEAGKAAASAERPMQFAPVDTQRDCDACVGADLQTVRHDSRQLKYALWLLPV